jgi:small subunit ribosomal protein S17e
MGSVKPSYIKNFAMDLLRTYESLFSPDFEQNKLVVSEYTDIKNKTLCEEGKVLSETAGADQSGSA